MSETTSVPTIEYGAIKAKSDADVALSLIHRVYRDAGHLEKDAPVPDKWKLYLELPTTHVYGAWLLEEDKRVLIGTVAFIDDSDFGVPMDKKFGSSMSLLREKGKIAEVAKLAIDKKVLTRMFGEQSEHENMQLRVSICMELFKLSIFRALACEFTSICIEVSEGHARMYHQIILFESIGEKQRALVRPSREYLVPMALDIIKLQKAMDEGTRLNSLYNGWVANPPSNEQLGLLS